MGVDTTRRDVALLYRRFAFGATAAELDAAQAHGYDSTITTLLTFGDGGPADAAPPTLRPDQPVPTDPNARKTFLQARAADTKALQDWWLRRMITSPVPATEKLAWYWHGHFATAVSKVQAPSLMLGQNMLFRSIGAGPFRDLAQAVAKDPAMLVWLDSNSNVKAHPNENFARELMELFTLGIGNYSEDDVKEAARCFTGWSYNRDTASFQLRPERHDNGSKTVLGHTANLGGEDVIDVVAASTTGAAFVTARLWSHFAYPIDAADPIVSTIVAMKPATVADTLRAIAQHPQFRSDATHNALIKQPIEWLVGALHALGVAYDPKFSAILQRLGQVPFDPPNVAGWPQNLYWVSTASALTRLAGASQIAAAADLHAVIAAPVAQRPTACARLLGINEWSTATEAALATASADPRALVALALCSPDYVLN